MTRIEQAKAVVEFAKASGFPDADLWFWEPDGACDGSGSESIEEIMFEHEKDKPVSIALSISLGTSEYVNRDNGRKGEQDPEEPALDIEELL